MHYQVKYLFCVVLFAMRSKNDKVNVYSNPNVDIMPSKCCMHLVPCFELSTHLMSYACTLVIEYFLGEYYRNSHGPYIEGSVEQYRFNVTVKLMIGR